MWGVGGGGERGAGGGRGGVRGRGLDSSASVAGNEGVAVFTGNARDRRIKIAFTCHQLNTKYFLHNRSPSKSNKE